MKLFIINLHKIYYYNSKKLINSGGADVKHGSSEFKPTK